MMRLIALCVLLGVTATSANNYKKLTLLPDNPNPHVSFTTYPPGVPTLVPEHDRPLPHGQRFAKPEYNPFYRPGTLVYGPPKAVKFVNFTDATANATCIKYGGRLVERWEKHHYNVLYRNGTVQPVGFPLNVFKDLERRHPIHSEITRAQHLVYGPHKPKHGHKDSEKRIVVGMDDRVEIPNTWLFPFQTVGRVGTGCTGTLIGPRHVLTAGHCVHSGSPGGWFDDMDFTLTYRPGPGGIPITFRTFAWSQVISVVGFTEFGDEDYDYALIILQDTTTKFPWMSFGYNSALEADWIININGFPGDKNRIVNNTMWHSHDVITHENNFQFDHLADTMGGNSGSGVYTYWSDGSRIIYGIHVRGILPDAPMFNQATRINKFRFYQLCSWINSPGLC